MKIYHFHPDTLQYLAQGVADPNPLEVGQWLIPGYATDVAPPTFSGNELCVWNDGGWSVVLKPEPEIEIPVPPPPPPSPEQIKEQIILATQNRLDAFARSRGYDSILSACTYASSAVQKFSAEGAYCLAARDRTWGALLVMLDEVQAGSRPIPAGYAEIEPELPALVWP